MLTVITAGVAFLHLVISYIVAVYVVYILADIIHLYYV